MSERRIKVAHLYWITWLMVFATITSAWHIDGVWDGVATLIIALITVWLADEGVKVYGAVDSGAER